MSRNNPRFTSLQLKTPTDVSSCWLCMHCTVFLPFCSCFACQYLRAGAFSETPRCLLLCLSQLLDDTSKPRGLVSPGPDLIPDLYMAIVAPLPAAINTRSHVGHRGTLWLWVPQVNPGEWSARIPSAVPTSASRSFCLQPTESGRSFPAADPCL